jgi:DNA-binding IclR family transcriptional regulator
MSTVSDALADRSLVPAVTRAVAILDLLATAPEPLGVSAIGRALDLPKSSVANICAALADAGMVRPVTGGFALGPHLAQLGSAYLSGVDEVALFHAALRHDTATGNETAQLATLGDGLEVVYLARRDGSSPVRLASAPGIALPANCTATGKAMLASLTREQLDARLAVSGPLKRLTASSITSLRSLRAELDAVRRKGYATDWEEVMEGVVCIAVGIPRADPNDAPLAVSFTLLAPRASEDTCTRLRRALTRLADDIGRGLGSVEPDRSSAP